MSESVESGKNMLQVKLVCSVCLVLDVPRNVTAKLCVFQSTP